jgi:hypothetical protein
MAAQHQDQAEQGKERRDEKPDSPQDVGETVVDRPPGRAGQVAVYAEPAEHGDHEKGDTADVVGLSAEGAGEPP